MFSYELVAYVSGLLAVMVFGVTAYMFFKKPAITPQSSLDNHDQASSITRGNQLRVLDADGLLKFCGMDSFINNNLHENLKLSPANFTELAKPVINAFCAYVQLLPASESHHHAQPGGLLIHTLEVAAYALRSLNDRAWPPNETTESRYEIKSAWIFSVLIASLLHDIGKPLANMKINLYEENDPTTAIPWIKEVGAINEMGKPWYSVDFLEKNEDYKLHATLGWSLFATIVPASTRQWLAETDSRILTELKKYLTGDESSIYHGVISKADQESTKRNLADGPKIRFASAKRKPMVEILMESATAVLADTGLLSVAKQANGAVFRVGDEVYIVCKPFADSVRDHINQNTKYSVPNDNTRIFQILLETRACQPNPFDDEKAVFDMRITSADGSKTFELTMLKFKCKDLFLNDWPVEFQGRLECMPTRDQAKNKEPDEPSASPTPLLPPKSLAEPEQPHFEHSNNSETQDVGYDIQSALNSFSPTPIIEIAEVKTELAPAQTHQPEPNPAEYTPEVKNDSVQKNEKQDSRRNRPAQKGKPKLSTIADPSKLADDAHTQESTIQSIPVAVDDGPEDLPANNIARSVPPTCSADFNFSGNPVILEPHLNGSSDIEMSLLHAQKYAKIGTNPEQEKQLVQDFIDWLKHGLSTGNVSFNQVDSTIHFVEEGMFILSPKIFIDQTGTFNNKERDNPGTILQRAVENSHLFEKTSQASRLWRAHIVDMDTQEPMINSRGHESLMTGYLIRDENLRLIISNRPSNNPQVKLKYNRKKAS